MIDSYESVVSRVPFVVRRRVRWGDCDPAGVVYTGRFTDYLLDAVTLFFGDLAGGTYWRWLETLEVDTPCKGMEFVFRGGLWPEDEFSMTCAVTAVREHSYDIGVEAVHADGRRIFTARFSPVCIGRGARERVPIPAAMLGALARHRASAIWFHVTAAGPPECDPVHALVRRSSRSDYSNSRN